MIGKGGKTFYINFNSFARTVYPKAVPVLLKKIMGGLNEIKIG